MEGGELARFGQRVLVRDIHFKGLKMKKFLFFILVCLSPLNSAFAGPVGFGIKGGLDMACLVSPLYSGPNTSSDVVFGFTGGVFVDMGLNDFLSFQPEANYTMKGNQINYHHIPVTPMYGTTIGFIDGTFTNTFNYFEVPLLLKAQTSLGPSFKGGLFTGPAPAFLLSASEHYTSPSPGDAALRLRDNFDLGWIVGAGIEINQFLLDVRYDFSFNTLFKNFTGSPNNSVLTLEVGYRIL